MTYFFDCLMHNVQKMLKYVNKTKFVLPMLIIIICTQILRLCKKLYSYISLSSHCQFRYTNGCILDVNLGVSKAAKHVCNLRGLSKDSLERIKMK